MMRTSARSIGLWPLWGLAVAALCAGCDPGGGNVRLIPIYPAGEPDFLGSDEIEQIVVELYRGDARDSEPVDWEILRHNDPLHFDDLADGPWIIVVRGIDAAGTEIVYGESKPFKISKTGKTDVRIFIARLREFNLVDVAPVEVADDLSKLSGHAATPFTDEDGKQWILITGGYKPGEIGSQNVSAYLIDTGEFTATKLDAVMSRGRVGHTAIAVEPPGRPPLVVVADSGSGPVETLEVYDTAAATFRVIDVPCGPSAPAGIVPALTRGAHGALVPSGRVILPGGDELCVVDPYGEKPAETWPSATGEAPATPALSAENAAGQLVVVDGDGVVSVTSAVEGGLAADLCLGGAARSVGFIAPRDGGALVAVGARDRFAVIGGGDSEGRSSTSDWAIVSLSGCDVRGVIEGDSGRPDAVVDPVVLDLSSADGAPQVDLLVTGGDVDPTERGAVLIGDAEDDTPLWYEEITGHTPAMHTPRQGHAVAVLDNRSAWVIGGGAGAEIFELGDKPKPLGAELRGFTERTPVLTAMTVLDATEAAERLTPLITNGDLLSKLFEQKTAATVYMFGTADRGIGDNLKLWTPYSVFSECGTRDDSSFDTVVKWGAVMGDMSGIVDIPEYIDPAANGGEAINQVQEAISAAMSAAKMSVQGSEGAGWPGVMPAAGPGDDVVVDGPCPWRQYVRTGFDGLGWEGSEKDATYSGVNVLIWAVSGDDCSQGVYCGLNAIGDEECTSNIPALPSEDELSEMDCDHPLMDDYFGLPPDDLLEGPAFEEIVKGLVWDPRDLIIGVVGQKRLSDSSADIKTLMPRRLGKVTTFLKDMGAQVVPMFVEGPKESTGFSEQLEALAARIAARNRTQACVPENLIGENSAPFEAGIGERGLFWPLDPEEEWAMSMKNAVHAQVRDNCRVFRRAFCPVAPELPAAGGVAECTRVEELTDGSWQIGIDTDLSAGCERGWTVTLTPEAEQASLGELFLQCNPG